MTRLSAKCFYPSVHVHVQACMHHTSTSEYLDKIDRSTLNINFCFNYFTVRFQSGVF